VSEPLKRGDFECRFRYRPPVRDSQRAVLAVDPNAYSSRCWRWTCPGCSQLRAWGIRSFIAGGAYEALLEGHTLVFWTLTERANARPYEQASAALSELLRVEGQTLKRAGHQPPRFCAVPEPQQRGAVHWHGMAALAPDAFTDSPWRSKHRWHDTAYAYGFGYQADVQLVTGPEAPRRAGYVAKYVAKDVHTLPGFSKRFRHVRSSTGPRRWFSRATAGECARRGVEVSAWVRDLRELVAELS
jgi:hypothetical protein